MASRFAPPGDCPVCGEFVPKGARACRECGSCERTGWSEEAEYDHLDLPDAAWEDDDGKAPRRPAASGWLTAGWWRWVALALVVLFLSGIIRAVIRA